MFTFFYKNIFISPKRIILVKSESNNLINEIHTKVVEFVKSKSADTYMDVRDCYLLFISVIHRPLCLLTNIDGLFPRPCHSVYPATWSERAVKRGYRYCSESLESTDWLYCPRFSFRTANNSITILTSQNNAKMGAM